MENNMINELLVLSALCVVMLIRLGGGCVTWLKERNSWGTGFRDFLNFYARVEMSGLDAFLLVVIFAMTLYLIISIINIYV